MRTPRTLWFLATLAALIPSAKAVQRGAFSMEILIDGRPVREMLHDGRTYVEAIPGREYAVRVTNHTGERIAVALSVDGLNSIDAKTTTARDATKWVLSPHESITLEGWQTSGSTARRFFFTTEEKSYGAWLGHTRDLGLVSAAFFQEKNPEVKRLTPSRRGERSQAAPSQGPPSAPREKRTEDGSALAEAPLSDDLAATGIGRELDHQVRWVEFEEETHASAMLEIRYEYKEALVRLGVLPREPRPVDPLARRGHARGFEDPGYAPDPYRDR